MTSRTAATVTVAALLLVTHLVTGGPSAQAPPAPPQVRATRLAQNPLITIRSSSSLGDNINNPTVIRVPSWIDKPLGRYYMYFAHHMGGFIRLAYADALAGPWTIYEPGVLPVRDTAFYRPQPDPPENLENFYTHVASPEIHIDEAGHRLVMWFHGWWTEGRIWPVGEAAARAWARERGYAQATQSAVSHDGLHFGVKPSVTRTSYLRVFPFDGMFYGMDRLGLLLRSGDPLGTFETGANVFRDTPYAARVRHVAILRRGDVLYTFFTAIGDTPERVLVSTIPLSGDWRNWKASPATQLLRPETPYECPTLAVEPSEGGDVKGPVRRGNCGGGTDFRFVLTTCPMA